MKNFFILFAVAATVALVAGDYNGSFGKDCPAKASFVADVIPVSYKKFIPDILNIFRDGYAQHYNICRMATIEWDEKLAEVAASTVGTCNLYYDESFNPKVYPSSVSIHSFHKSGTVDFDFVKIFGEAYLSWWSHQEKEPNFTPITVDRNTRVGCSAVNAFEDHQSYAYLVCNFAAGPSDGKPNNTKCVKPAQQCQTKINPKFPNLCSVHESYAAY